MNMLVPAPGGMYSTDDADGPLPLAHDINYLCDADSHSRDLKFGWSSRADVLVRTITDDGEVYPS